jgi:hypothetical protein
MKPGLKIFSGNSNKPLAEEICKSIGAPLGDATVTTFPDGETFVKINENVRGQDVYLVQSTCPPTNHHLMELLIMIDAARRASASRITAVIPFYGYARQDRKDQPRVPITAKLVANLLVAAGAHRVLTMDLHSQQIQGFFDIPVDHLYASPVFFDYLDKFEKANLVVCSPDVGGLKMASAYADILGAGLGFGKPLRVRVFREDLLGQRLYRELVIAEIEVHQVSLAGRNRGSVNSSSCRSHSTSTGIPTRTLSGSPAKSASSRVPSSRSTRTTGSGYSNPGAFGWWLMT